MKLNKKNEISIPITEQHVNKASRIGKWMRYLIYVVWGILFYLIISGDSSSFGYITNLEIEISDEFQFDKFNEIGIVNGRFIEASYADLEFSHPYYDYWLSFYMVMFLAWYFPALFIVTWLDQLFINIRRKKLFILKNIVLLRKITIAFYALILMPIFMDLPLYFFFSFGIDSNPFYTAKWIDVGYTFNPYRMFELLLLGLLLIFYWFAVAAREMYEDSKYTV